MRLFPSPMEEQESLISFLFSLNEFSLSFSFRLTFFFLSVMRKEPWTNVAKTEATKFLFFYPSHEVFPFVVRSFQMEIEQKHNFPLPVCSTQKEIIYTATSIVQTERRG